MTYLNVDEIETALQSLAAEYPELTELIELPHPTHEGRRTRCLRIGADPDRNGVLLLGGVHAREWVPPDALVSLAADLLEAGTLGTGLVYGNHQVPADRVRQVLEGTNLYVFACVNPDGRHHSQTAEPMWRKNRRPHPAGGICTGVDINRNFDFLWDHTATFHPEAEVATSADPCDPRQVYHGPSAASEPETRNVVHLLDTHPGIRWHVDVHSFVPVILHNWGSDEHQTTDPQQNFRNPDFDMLRGIPGDTAYREYLPAEDLEAEVALGTAMSNAIRQVRGDVYEVVPSFGGLYPTSGTSDDYAYSRHLSDPQRSRVLGFTIECAHSFQPPWTEAEHVIREVSAGLIALAAEVAGEARSEGQASTDQQRAS
ncbi:M14 family metallopeptidase [Kocuria nitroreducens]|uniref:M14 family metallopeptidase n=1 Tax=Kocuria nitroreducens TaxID=3058914 RepID=UPI0036D9C006